tara:strand:+ start:54178 stop:54981 length:804 start_codon:yes stop_codon:yes gene_type:complete
VNILELWNDAFLQKSYKHMSKDKKCCLDWFDLSSADSVLWLTCAFRTLASSMAIVACYISWLQRDHFWNDKHYTTVSAFWCVPPSLWLISTIPHIICLVQCAAGNNSKLFAFRRRVTIWILHDIILGIFWLYLACMLYDLADDQDDSEWRTIFLSMLSWHIVIVVLQQIYFTDVWSTSLNVSCCDPKMIPRWKVFIKIFSLGIIYVVIMVIIKANETITMKCSLSSVVIFSIAVVVGCISKFEKRVKQQILIHSAHVGKKDGVTLFF